MAPSTKDSALTTSAHEVDGELSDALLREVSAALDVGDHDTVTAQVHGLHVPDQAELIESLPSEKRRTLAEMLGEDLNHDLLPELSPEAADDVLDALGPETSAAAIAQLETDEAVSVIEEMGTSDQQEILQAVPPDTRAALEERLAFAEDSAGRLMRKKFVSVPAYWSVGDTIDYMRSHTDLPSRFYVIYATDPRYRPIGRVLLSDIMQNRRESNISTIMNRDVHPVSLDVDQEEIAFRFRKYGLVEAPVIDEGGRLIGTISVDDVVDVIQEEEEEDFLLRGGVRSQDLQASLASTVRKRFPWLFINLLTAVLASIVIGFFTETIEKLVALAVLMPIVASMGGNAGTQSATVTVRGIATRQLKPAAALNAIRKELFIGAINGFGLAIIMGAGAYLWYDDTKLGIVFALATLVTLAFAGLSGAAIPLLLTRMKIDPAVAASVFLTTVTDIVGFFLFLGLAAWWIG